MKSTRDQERPALLCPDLSHALSNDFLLRVTMTRRRIGGHRTVELTFAKHGDTAVILSGYPGKRDWVANIAAHREVTIHTVQGPRFYDIPGIARRVTGSDERTPLLLTFLGRWSKRAGLVRPLLASGLWMVGLMQALRLPWWGPLYPVRLVMDRMPCVEVRFAGEAVQRPSPPDTSEQRQWE